MKFDAIIFDCDGTLVDSERVGNEALIECVAELGLRISLDDALNEFAGRKMADTLGLIELRLGRPLPSDFLPRARKRMAQAFEERLEAMEGVHTLLEKLTIPFCVASNGPTDKMRVSLGVTRLLPYFESKIFSAYDCGSWKPEPGLFLHSATAMGVSPDRCAVIEDSPIGVIAGIRAGMTVFGYAPKKDGKHLAEAGAQVFRDMGELLALLK